MDKINCRTCNFDLASLSMTLPQPHAEKRQLSGNRDIEVYCPVCGEKHLNLMKNKNFFLREKWSSDGKREGSEWLFWVNRQGHAVGGSQQAGTVPIGQLNILFGEQAKPIKVDYIHYPVVARFTWTEPDGKKDALPLLPVKPEYLDCLDPVGLEAIRRGDKDFQPQILEEGGKRYYRCIIPRRGASREQWLQEPTKIELGPDVEGLFLRHWPNIDDLRWRVHLVSLGFDDGKGIAELKNPWEMHVLWPRTTRNDDQQLIEDESIFYSEVVKIEPSGGSSKRVFTVYSEGRDGLHYGRPAWVGLASNGCGGLFALPVPRSLGTTPLVDFGIDFGTSNTVIAVKDHGGGDGVSINTVKPGNDLTRWIFGRIDTKNDPDDLWPGVPWTGGSRDLLPSELLLREGKDWHSVTSDPLSVNALKLGVDVAIPLMLAQPLRDPARSQIRKGSLLSDFKWKRAMDERGLAVPKESLAAIQARFLEAAFLTAIASRIKQSNQYPTSINIRYSWPPAFTAGDHETLSSAMGSDSPSAGGTAQSSLRTRLTRLVSDGNKVEVVRGLDEATASAYADDINCRFLVFVDVGGGSVEVVIRDTKAGKADRLPDRNLDDVLVRRSLYFGGGVFLRSLVGDASSPGSSCTSAGVDYSTLAAQVRRYASGTELLSAPNLFSSARISTVRARARAYGEAIADLVARLIVGVCLEAGLYNPKGGDRFDWKSKDSAVPNISCNRLVSVKKNQLDDEYGFRIENDLKFNIFLLGLGWNAVGIGVASGTLENSFAKSVQARVSSMLESEKDASSLISDGDTSVFDLVNDGRLALACPALDRKYEHRKAVVAKRLIERQVEGGAVEDGVLSAPGVIGLSISLGERKIPWFRRVGADPNDIRNVKGGGDPHSSRRTDKMYAQILEARQAAAPPANAPTSLPGTPSAPQAPMAPSLLVGGSPPPLLTPVKEWHVANATKQPMGQWDIEALVQELLKHADRGNWMVWKPTLSGWQAVSQVPELWQRLQPKTQWTVAFGSTILGSNLDSASAVALIRGTPDPRSCKAWCSEFGPVWKQVSEIPEFVSALPAGPPPLP